MVEHVAPQLIPEGELVTVPVGAPVLAIARVKLGAVPAGPKVAVTLWEELIATVQAPFPEHAPLQPVNADPELGMAAKLTIDPAGKLEEQAEPQLMPAGRLVTVPLPDPASATERPTAGAKTAMTEASEFIATEQVPVPAQAAPLHPIKVEPAAAVAVRFTTAPALKRAEQVVPQLIPDGVLLTVPDPEPLRVVDNEYWGEPVGPKLAVTVWLEFMVRLQPSVPVQAPVHPVNALPTAGATTKETTVPCTKVVEQAVPHEIDAGLLTTVPPLEGFSCTNNCSEAGAAPVCVLPFEAVPDPALLPLSSRVTVPPPPPPPHAVRAIIRQATARAPSFKRRPATKFTQQLLACGGDVHQLEFLGPAPRQENTFPR